MNGGRPSEWRCGEERGAVAGGLLLLLACLAFLELLQVGGRISSTRPDIRATARGAARAATQAAGSGTASGQIDIAPMLEARDIDVSHSASITGNTSFTSGGFVEVKVDCTISMADITLPGFGTDHAVRDSPRAGRLLSRMRTVTRQSEGGRQG